MEISQKNFFALSTISKVPFSEETLIRYRNTHLLVAVPELSILELREKVSNDLFYSPKGSWYAKQAFAKNCGKSEWHLIRKSTVKNSLSKNFREQQELLSDKEEIPDARTIVYAAILYFLVMEKRLFQKIYLRCSDIDSDGERVIVGEFTSKGFCIAGDRDDYRYGEFGIASAIKHENLKA